MIEYIIFGLQYLSDLRVSANDICIFTNGSNIIYKNNILLITIFYSSVYYLNIVTLYGYYWLY